MSTSCKTIFVVCAALIAVLSGSVALAQNAPTQEQIPTFQSGVNLVLVPVIVRNKQGQLVNGLIKDDFEIFDKGKRQEIVSFSAVQHPSSAARSQPAPGRQRSVQEGAVLTANIASPATPESGRTDATPQRNIVYLFDDLDATFADFAAVRSAMVSHIRAGAATDHAAIYTFSGHPQLDFTTDRGKLGDTAAKLRMSLSDLTADKAKECPDINYYLADLIVNKDDRNARKAATHHTAICEHVPEPFPAESIMEAAAQQQLAFVPQDSRIALRTLRLAIKRLAEMPGERIVILISPGFFQTFENIGDMQQILKLAAQANVTINALNARGLYSNQPDASERDDNYAPWWRYRLESFQAAEEVMRDLTQATGGVFINNNDGFRQAFDRLAAPPEFSYVLGFVPSASKPDGTFHPIKIRLANQKGLTIQARRGYYALSQDPAKQTARLEVDDAVFSRDERNELPVAFQTGYLEPNNSDPTLTAVVKVDVKSLHFRFANQRNLDSLTVVAAVFDEDGSYLTGTSTTVNLQLRSETLKNDRSVTLHLAFHVKRGAYLLRLVIRDMQSGAMTTVTRPETIT